tara:strand:- start:1246 stop:1356 length:111 start_codon:yes stop_codon:yes gene_type:complete
MKWIKNNPMLATVIFVAIVAFSYFGYMHWYGDPTNW